jgi:hypothetical protein
MPGENDDKLAAPSVPSHEALTQEWLNDFIDELSRSAFQRALERRHAAPAYRTVIESVNLVAGVPPSS